MSQQAFMQFAEALGSTVELRILTDSVDQAEALCKKLWKRIEGFERAFSRFIASSELSTVNSQHGQPVAVSDEFMLILKESEDFNTRTEGLFNPFVLPALQRAGYTSSLTASGGQIASDYRQRAVPQFSDIKISGSSVQIPENSALDFGGIGKGFLADRLAELAQGYTINFCLSLGGDMVLSGHNQGGSLWEVAVQSARKSTQNVANVVCEKTSYAVATSGKVRSRNKQRQIHSIDPRTARPSESDCSMATVVARDAVTADVIAGCCVIGGKEFAQKMHQSSDVFGILLQSKDGNITTLGDCFGEVDA